MAQSECKRMAPFLSNLNDIMMNKECASLCFWFYSIYESDVDWISILYGNYTII